MSRKVTVAQKKQIAATQRFKCNNKPGSNLLGLSGYNCPLWLSSDDNTGIFDKSGYEIDHITEWSLTKDDSLENLQALCLMCHRVKTTNFTMNKTVKTPAKKSPKVAKPKTITNDPGNPGNPGNPDNPIAKAPAIKKPKQAKIKNEPVKQINVPMTIEQLALTYYKSLWFRNYAKDMSAYNLTPDEVELNNEINNLISTYNKIYDLIDQDPTRSDINAYIYQNMIDLKDEINILQISVQHHHYANNVFLDRCNLQGHYSIIPRLRKIANPAYLPLLQQIDPNVQNNITHKVKTLIQKLKGLDQQPANKECCKQILYMFIDNNTQNIMMVRHIINDPASDLGNQASSLRSHSGDYGNLYNVIENFKAVRAHVDSGNYDNAFDLVRSSIHNVLNLFRMGGNTESLAKIVACVNLVQSNETWIQRAIDGLKK